METDAEIYLTDGIVQYTAEICNNGEKPTEAVTLRILDEAENVIYTTSLVGSIAPGGTYVFTDRFAPEDGSAVHTFTLDVSTDSDGNAGNNREAFSVGSVDLGIYDASFVEKGDGGYNLQVILSNEGSTNVSDAMLQIYKNAPEGTPVFEAAVNNVRSGAHAVVSF